MLRRTIVPTLAFLAGFFASAGASAPKGPPQPADYDALVRFQVEGFGNERALQFHAMKRYLVEAGFKEDPDDPVTWDNTRATMLHGTLPSAKAPRMLAERHVQTIRLAPVGFKPDKDKPHSVRVELELNAGLSREHLRQLKVQVLKVLAPLGFTEAFGYDDRGLLRVVGRMQDINVDALAGDLRRHPAGWELLSKTLLTDLQQAPNGTALLRQILDDWYDHPEGKGILLRALARWRSTPQGIRFLQTLPPEVVNSDSKLDRITVEVNLLAHMSASPAAVDVCRHVLADVLESKANRELMDMLLKRVNTQLNGLDLPLFYRTVAPIRVVEVFPTLPAPSIRANPQAIPPGQEKISSDLRELLANKAEETKTRRMELIFALPPAEDDRVWRRLLREAVPEAAIEGRLGTLVAVQAPTLAALKFAALNEIAVVRLPRLARVRGQNDPAGEKFQPLRKSDGDRLHRVILDGRGQRVAVIDADFRGWEKLRGNALPEKTRLVDLTRERNITLLPDPEVGPPNELGRGTRFARALVRSAPSVDLTLIRIDPGASYQVAGVARVINGEAYQSLNIDHRLIDLEDEHARLQVRKDLLLEQRREILDDFGVDDETVKRRKDYFKRQAEHDKEEKDYAARVQRLVQLGQDVRSLQGIRVVASALVWTDGYPVDGASTLSRYFDDRPFKGGLWFQAAGNTQGQAWTGFFRDVDNNSVMEFVPPGTPLPEGGWSRELNWLAWKAADGQESRELPANTLLRITLQWREAHDRSFHDSGDDAFRQPLAQFRVVLCQQLDPRGEKRPSDDLEAVAETVGLPQRLDKTPDAGIYEQVLQVRLPRAGRYLVRIEGKAPDSTRPENAPTIPTAKRVGEVYPRLFVETLGGPGKAVWHTYATQAGTLGMPADASRIVTVGSDGR